MGFSWERISKARYHTTVEKAISNVATSYISISVGTQNRPSAEDLHSWVGLYEGRPLTALRIIASTLNWALKPTGRQFISCSPRLICCESIIPLFKLIEIASDVPHMRDGRFWNLLDRGIPLDVQRTLHNFVTHWWSQKLLDSVRSTSTEAPSALEGLLIFMSSF